MQQVKAGLDAIALSGWQVAGMPAGRRDVPIEVAVSGRLGAAVVRRINNAAARG
jgi:isocitrate lyase